MKLWHKASDGGSAPRWTGGGHALGNSRPAGPAFVLDHLEPGLAAIRFVYDAMRIDQQWSELHDRGFTWWGDRHAQRVWAEPGIDDDGIVIYRLCAETNVVRDLEFTPRQSSIVNLLNGMAVTSALLESADEGVLRYSAAMWVHADSIGWVARLLAWVTALQAAHAEAQSEFLSKTLEGGVPA